MTPDIMRRDAFLRWNIPQLTSDSLHEGIRLHIWRDMHAQLNILRRRT